MKEQITYDTFNKVDIRVGTVISVQKNEKARKPNVNFIKYIVGYLFFHIINI